MREYKGLIIGGHNDGKRHTYSEPFMRMPIRMLVTASPKSEEIPTEPSIGFSERYKYEKFEFWNDRTREKREFGFWVPEDCENPSVYIMENLIAGYK